MYQYLPLLQLIIFITFTAVVTAGFDIAFEVFGIGASDDLLSAEQRKLLEAASKRKREDEAAAVAAAWAARPARPTPSSYLPLNMAGVKRKRDRTNSPCHLCQ